MYDIVDEHFVFVAMGLVSIAYACSWIYKFRKRKETLNRWHYAYITLAFIVIILGLSTFFTKFSLNCLCDGTRLRYQAHSRSGCLYQPW